MLHAGFAFLYTNILPLQNGPLLVTQEVLIPKLRKLGVDGVVAPLERASSGLQFRFGPLVSISAGLRYLLWVNGLVLNRAHLQ